MSRCPSWTEAVSRSGVAPARGKASHEPSPAPIRWCSKPCGRRPKWTGPSTPAALTRWIPRPSPRRGGWPDATGADRRGPGRLPAHGAGASVPPGGHSRSRVAGRAELRGVLADPTLSLAAKGVLAFVLTRPPGTRVTLALLSSSNPDPDAVIEAALRELARSGLVPTAPPEGRGAVGRIPARGAPPTPKGG